MSESSGKGRWGRDEDGVIGWEDDQRIGDFHESFPGEDWEDDDNPDPYGQDLSDVLEEEFDD